MRKVLSVLVAGVMFGACSDGLKSDLTKEDVSRFITTEEFISLHRADISTLIT